MILARILLSLIAVSAAPAYARYVVGAETVYLSSERYSANQLGLNVQSKEEDHGYSLGLFGQDRKYDGGGGFREGGYSLGGYKEFRGGYVMVDASHSPGAVTYAKVRGSVEPRLMVGGNGEIGMGVIAAQYTGLSTFALHPVTTWSLPRNWRVDAGAYAVFTDQFIASGHAAVRHKFADKFEANAFVAAGRVIEDATVIAAFHQWGIGVGTYLGRSKFGLNGSLYNSTFREEKALGLTWEFPL